MRLRKSRGRNTNLSKIVRLTGQVTHTCEINIMHEFDIVRVAVQSRPAIVNV